ncbi:response receiver sensor histidine kinase response regulator, PAS domain-containing [Geotalea daltonii FRC-32]|uniref:histidine kinase n=1 Tax=Geotalea daltonii (strain DSM 22248 / JCM 15807 / FRC-32) TaxID=316067 RepID=B9M7B6_GEODF|nr:response regulator [Geotalea daltonii]ACM20204.1 response receiver sensor histidine kinase response regulator, PAS domain-containing [Geotalea daltonii FRC-32]
MWKQPVSILLVDDREENLTALEALLSDMGLDMVKALSGNDALRLALKQDFALVLMDVQMPEMDGFETAELMRSNPKTRHLPIIFVTAGMKDMSYQFKGYDAGAVDYLLKPLEPAILRSKVRVFRALYTQRCALEERESTLEALVEERTAELVRTTENLQESEERYRNAFELAAVGIAHVALNGLLVRVNASMCRDLGYDPGELQKLTLAEITHGEDLALDQAEVQSLLSGCTSSYEMEKRFLRKNGSIVWGHMAVALARGESGEPIHYITVFENITARKQLEQQLRQAQKMEAIGQLAGGIAHDFNNLLSVIIGYGNLAQMKMDADDPLKCNLDQIIAAAEKAAQLTKGLLAFSRKQEMKQQPVELNGLIESVTKILKRVIGEDIQLETSFHEGTLFINGDSGQIDQVLMNLATNARDAMPDGGKFTVSTALQEIEDSFIAMHGFGKPGAYALINVSDSGKGMDQHTLQNIFDPFFTTKEVGKGTGLGMSIVYGIVTQHNGYIKVYSEPDIGTTFRLYLPLIEDNQVEEAKLSPALPRGGTETILLAEDDQAIRDMEVSILQDFGYLVMVARDGQEAVDIFQENRGNIDLVLLDMIMPKKNGSEACREIRVLAPQVKVLFISGYTADLIQEKGLLEKGVELVIKPVSPPELARKVRELLDR